MLKPKSVTKVKPTKQKPKAVEAVTEVVEAVTEEAPLVKARGAFIISGITALYEGKKYVFSAPIDQFGWDENGYPTALGLSFKDWSETEINYAPE